MTVPTQQNGDREKNKKYFTNASLNQVGIVCNDCGHLADGRTDFVCPCAFTSDSGQETDRF